VDIWVLTSIRFPGLVYTPKLPLRIRPDMIFEGVGSRPGKDCRDVSDCFRGTFSRVLELVDELMMLFILEVELRVGVRDGRGSSPPLINGLDLSCPLSDVWR
jgi:hypothetical protein